MTFEISVVRPKIILLSVIALVGLVVGCTSDEPQLPASTDAAAIADRVTGADGRAFLNEITSASWNDDGRRAGELFAWIRRDAKSADRDAAIRAGETAQAIASFLADDRESLSDAPANPALWRSFVSSLVPYLGAMVGDERGVAGFAPLDGLDSQMRHTASMFAAMTKDADANRIITEAAAARAHSYEVAFAVAAVAEPLMAHRGDAQQNLLRAARLRSLIKTGAYIADPGSEKPAPALAQTEVAYQVASLTARPDDPHIDPKFFRDGRLLSPTEIPDDSWSIYDSQLTVYLATWPRIIDAIRQFGRTYMTIAAGQ